MDSKQQSTIDSAREILFKSVDDVSDELDDLFTKQDLQKQIESICKEYASEVYSQTRTID